jgi:O-antigen/teichoic acid export membrane protein
MVKSNILKISSNYLARLWGIVSVFVFIPLYIKYLGVESYAVIGFYSLLLGITGFIDSGMSSAVLKEFSIENTSNYKYSILTSIEKKYIIICFILIIIFIVNSNFISNSWLTSEFISSSRLQYYIVLISIGICLQLLSSLYYGAFFGLNEQVRANMYQIIWSVSKSLLVIIYFIFFNANLEIYFWWQIICNLLYLIILRYSIIKKLEEPNGKLNIIIKKIPKHILSYIINVTFIAILTSLNGYADKLIASSLFTLSVFGFYNIASTISQFPLYVSSPLVLFVFPSIARLYHEKKIFRLNHLIFKIYVLLIIVTLPIVFTVISFNKEIMGIWTGKILDGEAANSYGTLIKFLVSGYFFTAMQLPLYYILLASDRTRFSVIQSIVQILVGVPLLYISAKFYGITYIGAVWFFLSFFSFLSIFIYSVRKNVLVIRNKRIFFQLILLPLLVNILIYGSVFSLNLIDSVGFFVLAPFIFCLSIVISVICNNYQNHTKLLSLTNILRFYN